MTLAQDFLERGVVYGGDDEMRKSIHQIIMEHLKPIGQDPSNAKSHAEQFIFDEEVPTVLWNLIEGGHIDREATVAMARLPSASTWVEWPVEVPGASGCKMGILMVDGVIQRAGFIGPKLCGLFFIMRTAKAPEGMVACFGCIGMPIPINLDKDSIAVAFWKDFTTTKEGEKIPPELMKDMKAFVWDGIDALFLIMTPRVCEVRHVEYSGKANRRRKASGKLPLVEYKRMILRVGIGTPRYVTHGGPAPLVKDLPSHHKRLHRVIGHFRTYRAHRETPRVSFVPEHWRGDEALGVVLHTRHVKGEEK